MGTLVDNGGCYFNGEIILPLPEVMAMKDELADLRAFKATTTPAATTGAAHPGKRARVQQDTLPAIARFRGAARCFYDFQFRGEGERCGAGIVSIKSSWTGDLHKHHECCEIPSTCTFCKKPDHDDQRCWDIAEDQLAQAAQMKSDTEDILKSKHKKAFMAGFAANDPDE